MKGIVLAGGSGTRLYPITKSVSKQLLPIYDKPMIYYPISVLMLAGIKDILLITTEEDQAKFQNLLGDGSHLGLNFEYKIQPSPDGLAQAFILGEEFIKDDDVCLILGDNIYYGHDLINLLSQAVRNVTSKRKATIFGYYVKDPNRYGVVEFSPNGDVKSLTEKPSVFKSNYAVTGLYFYPNDVIHKAHQVKPSSRGELEITSINKMYLNEGSLKVEILGRGFTWFDTGTTESLSQASNLIEAIEKRQGLKIACIEEIAYNLKYISLNELVQIAMSFKNNEYGKYLLSLSKKDY